MGPGTRPPFGASKRKPNASRHSDVPCPRPCATLPCPGPAADNQGSSAARLGNATSFRTPGHLPLCPGASTAAGTGGRPRRRHRGPGADLAAHAHATPPHPTRTEGEDAGPEPAPRAWRPGASPACVGTWRPPRPRPQQRPGSPGAAGWASQAPCTASVASAAPLEVCWRPTGVRGAGPERSQRPRPTLPATTGLQAQRAPQAQGPKAVLKMIPLGGTVAPEMRPPWRARPLPPPFVGQKRPSEAPEAVSAS